MFLRFAQIIVLLVLTLQIQAQDIFEASRKGDLKMMKSLYEKDISCINQKNSQEYSPLVLACYYNQLEIVKFLIEKEVKLNTVNNSSTALQASSYKGFTEITKELLKYKADPNIVDANGTSPLIYATQFKHFEIIKLLLVFGANREYKDQSGNTALDYAEKLKIEGGVEILRIENN